MGLSLHTIGWLAVRLGVKDQTNTTAASQLAAIAAYSTFIVIA
jgi:hypothetical protein